MKLPRWWPFGPKRVAPRAARDDAVPGRPVMFYPNPSTTEQWACICSPGKARPDCEIHGSDGKSLYSEMGRT